MVHRAQSVTPHPENDGQKRRENEQFTEGELICSETLAPPPFRDRDKRRHAKSRDNQIKREREEAEVAHSNRSASTEDRESLARDVTTPIPRRAP